jgi:hypothetical protein
MTVNSCSGLPPEYGRAAGVSQFPHNGPGGYSQVGFCPLRKRAAKRRSFLYNMAFRKPQSRALARFKARHTGGRGDFRGFL